MAPPIRNFTEHERAQIKLASAVGYSVEQIARLLNTSSETLYKHCAEELQTGMDHVNFQVAGKLFQKCMAGDTTAIIFWMKTRFKWAAALGDRPPPSPHGQTVEIADLSGWTEEELAQYERFNRKLLGNPTGPAPGDIGAPEIEDGEFSPAPATGAGRDPDGEGSPPTGG